MNEVTTQYNTAKLSGNKPDTLWIVVIIAIVLGMAGGSYALRQYSIAQDVEIGKKELEKQAAQQHHPENQSVEEQKMIARQKQFVKVLEDSLSRNPQDTSLYLTLGSMRINTGDTLGAIEMYKKYIQVNPGNENALTDYAYLLFMSGNPNEGIALTEKVLAKNVRNQIALYNMSVMKYKQGNLNSAAEWMQRCFKVDSANELGMQARIVLGEFEKMKNEKQP